MQIITEKINLTELRQMSEQWIGTFVFYHWRQKNQGKLGELLRLKEVLGDYFMGENQYKSSAENLNRYFYPFNYAARKIYYNV